MLLGNRLRPRPSPAPVATAAIWGRLYGVINSCCVELDDTSHIMFVFPSGHQAAGGKAVWLELHVYWGHVKDDWTWAMKPCGWSCCDESSGLDVLVRYFEHPSRSAVRFCVSPGISSFCSPALFCSALRCWSWSQIFASAACGDQTLSFNNGSSEQQRRNQCVGQSPSVGPSVLYTLLVLPPCGQTFTSLQV